MKTLEFKTREKLIDFYESVLEIAGANPVEYPRTLCTKMEDLTIKIEEYGELVAKLMEEYLNDGKCKLV